MGSYGWKQPRAHTSVRMALLDHRVSSRTPPRNRPMANWVATTRKHGTYGLETGGLMNNNHRPIEFVYGLELARIRADRLRKTLIWLAYSGLAVGVLGWLVYYELYS